MGFALDIVLTFFRVVLTGWIAGWFKREPKDVTIENAKVANEIEDKNSVAPSDDVSKRLSRWERD
jgi:hypothetical protein